MTTTRCLLIVAKILVWATLCNAGCSSEYGSEPCSFVPSPPGHAPPCAKPGMTYCEDIHHYPEHLIHYLIDKWRFNHRTLLSDETKYDYSAYFHQPDYKYGRNTISDSYYPDPIYVPKSPSSVYHHPHAPSGGNTYIPPITTQNHTDGFRGYPDRRVPIGSSSGYKYSAPINSRPSIYTVMSQPPAAAASFNNQQEWFGRFSRDSRKYLRNKRSKQSESQAPFAPLGFNSTEKHSRKKRQTTGQSLCQSRSQYVMPKAALNNKGNWMYVVNMDDNRYTQLVKSEICASQQCNGLCSLPNGYTSRCEQKYVQKRLVALEGTGGQLYTDVFWFPSCCVCTISN